MKVEIIIRNPRDPESMYVIEIKDQFSVWIGRGDGEGGEFRNQAVFDCVDKFYKDNF